MLAFIFFITNTKGQILENINLTDYRKEAYLFDSDSLLKAKTTTMLSDRKKEVEEKKNERCFVFYHPQQMPQFPGGDGKLMEYLRANLQPTGSLVEGQVIVRFVIDKDSTIKNVEVIRSLSEEADAEAVRVVSSMPNWIPGMNNNRHVSMNYTLPILFRDAKSKKKNNKR